MAARSSSPVCAKRTRPAANSLSSRIRSGTASPLTVQAHAAQYCPRRPRLLLVAACPFSLLARSVILFVGVGVAIVIDYRRFPRLVAKIIATVEATPGPGPGLGRKMMMERPQKTTSALS